MTQPSPNDHARRRAFAAAHIRDARTRGPIPSYGSRAWHELPYADPRRWAAVLIAAEAWAQDGEPDVMRRRLEDEITAARQVADAQEQASWTAMLHRYAADIAQPTRAELQARRGVA